MKAKPIVPPPGREVFEGDIATYWIDNDGILISVSKSPTRTVENITANVALVKKITHNKKAPLLIYLSKSGVPDKETRKFAAKQLPEIYSAMAMVSRPGLSKFIMNLLFRLKPPPVPMKNFINDKEAKEWLKHFL